MTSKVRTARRVAEAALLQLEMLETLEHAYDTWLELRVEHAAFLTRCAEERRKIDQQGEFLVGAVRAAAQLQSVEVTPDVSALAKPGGDDLKRVLADAEAKIRAARESLESELATETQHYDAAFQRIRDEVQGRVQRLLAGSPPKLRMLLRPVGRTNTLLHVERVTGDDAVFLLYALTGRIPSRYGFLFDDSTDDVMKAPQPLYPDEGVEANDTRPEPAALRAYVERSKQVLSVKGFIPVFVPRPGGGEDFFRLLQRGPVMEVELLRGADFTSILERAEGERFAGHLLRLKLAGKIELEMEAS